MTRPAAPPAAPGAHTGTGLQFDHVVIPLLAGIALFFLIEPVYKSFLPVTLSYNGGWNAYHALHALQGVDLYASTNPLTVCNYPPLSFYLIGALGSVFGDALFAGRMLALLAFFVTALNIAIIVTRICGQRAIGIFAGIFYVATMAGVYDKYVGISDPQMLGHALMTSGLAILVGAESRRRNLFLSALLICAGGFVKHNLVSLPIAVAIYLFVHHRDSFRFWMLCMLGSLAVGFSVILGAFGMDFIESLNNPRRFTLLRLGRKLLSEPMKLQIPIVTWLLYSAFAFRERTTLLIGSYVFTALVTAIGFSGGDGVAINVFFDAVIGLSIAAGLALDRVQRTLSGPGIVPHQRLALMTVVSLAMSFGILIHLPAKAYHLATALPELRTLEADTAIDVAYLEAVDAPAFCEDLSLCFRAEKALEVDTFHARQLISSGEGEETLLLDKIHQHYFGVIQLDTWDPARDDERMFPALIEAIERCYRIDRISANGVFFLPIPERCTRDRGASLSGGATRSMQHSRNEWAVAIRSS